MKRCLGVTILCRKKSALTVVGFWISCGILRHDSISFCATLLSPDSRWHLQRTHRYHIVWSLLVSVMPSSHRQHGQHKTVLSRFVRGVKRVGGRLQQFLVVLNILEIVRSCHQFCSHRQHRQDKTVLSQWWCELGIKDIGPLTMPDFMIIRDVKIEFFT